MQCQFFFNQLPSDKCSNLLIVAAFSNSGFSDKISFLVKSSYLSTFSDDKADTLAVCLSNSY